MEYKQTLPSYILLPKAKDNKYLRFIAAQQPERVNKSSKFKIQESNQDCISGILPLINGYDLGYG